MWHIAELFSRGLSGLFGGHSGVNPQAEGGFTWAPTSRRPEKGAFYAKKEQ